MRERDIPQPGSIFMMDLLATVPYYTAYLSRALLQAGANVTVGSITYYLDPACFASRGLHNKPGLVDLVGRFQLPRVHRRIFKLFEVVLNLSALTLRFLRVPPDIVHVQYMPMLRSALPLDLWFLKICRARGSTIVLTVHDLLPHDSGDRYRPVFQNLYHFADTIICHSVSIKQRLVAEFEIHEDKISVIPHGPFFFDLPSRNSDSFLKQLHLPTNATLVLWQGLVFPYKGLDLLLDAWQLVERENEQAYLIVAGTGDPLLLASLQEQAKRLGLTRIRLHQEFITTGDLTALYRAADVVVYPYRAITTSGALATGLAFGKAILATDLPVFREILTNEENALLVRPEKDLLSRGLLILLSDPELRKSFSARIAGMHFGESSWHDIALKTISAYNKFITPLRK